ncbi:MAG: MFS transporter [Chloroflexota bacterium]|nr:MFS transporter [Chloroflexota bacterium]
MSRPRIILVTIGLMLGLFMASMEVTVVSTAMPTIVGELGGLALYSWVFSAYMVTSTTTIPLFGKLSDIYGRRSVYAVAMLLFLVGSLLCGRATSMTQLVAFRALQGLGAGGVAPLTFVVIGAMFTLEQRAKMQGVFASIWGLSSVVGPLLGGFLVDQVSWPWIFYINVAPGLLALALFWVGWREPEHDANAPLAPIDYWGAALLTAGVVLFLLGLMNVGTTTGWALLTSTALVLGGLAWVERRAADPVLPVALFGNRMFAVACLHGVLTGAAMFGCLSYVPLFVQVALNTSATAAGAALTPMIIGWVIASIIGSRLLLRFGYLFLVIGGTASLTVGAFLLSQMGANASRLYILTSLTLMGIGMGMSISPFLIVVQSIVQRRLLGIATSTIQFSRTIGGTIGVSVMGVMLSLGLTRQLIAAGLDPTVVSVDSLLDGLGEGMSVELAATLRTALTLATQNVFLVAFITAALGLVVTLFTPRGLLPETGTQSPPIQLRTEETKLTSVAE